MKITFISVGAIKKPYARLWSEEYLKRITRYASLEVADIKEEGGAGPKDAAARKEGERITKKLKPGDFVIVLGDRGRQMGSREFAAFLGGLMDKGTKGVAFITGGPYGLSPAVEERADLTLSLSAMTLPHDMARVVLAEQVYRAFTILKGEPYSH